MAVLTVIPTKDVKLNDVRDTLNANGGNVSDDLTTFFTDGTQSRQKWSGDPLALVTYYPNANINKWAKYKPIRNSKLLPLYADYLANNGSMSIESINPLIQDTAGFAFLDTIRNGIDGYTHLLPQGGASEPYRLTDYRGYTSITPDLNIKDVTDIDGDASVNFYYDSDTHKYIAQFTNWERINITERAGCLKPSEISIGNKYLSAIFKIQTGSSTYIYRCCSFRKYDYYDELLYYPELMYPTKLANFDGYVERWYFLSTNYVEFSEWTSQTNFGECYLLPLKNHTQEEMKSYYRKSKVNFPSYHITILGSLLYNVNGEMYDINASGINWKLPAEMYLSIHTVENSVNEVYFFGDGYGDYNPLPFPTPTTGDFGFHANTEQGGTIAGTSFDNLRTKVTGWLNQLLLGKDYSPFVSAVKLYIDSSLTPKPNYFPVELTIDIEDRENPGTGGFLLEKTL